MPIAREIAQHLPYLRRFARALTGQQSKGDDAVVSVLQALVADPGAFPRDVPAKVALYALFLERGFDARVAGAAPAGAAERNLEGLAPRSRQAFLLRNVEGFGLDEIGAILGVGPDEAAALVTQAGEEIAAQVATRVLIIEDEPIIALDIEAMVQGLGHEVTGIARTHREALDLVRQRRPGLILADIQLADGSSGLEAVNEILTGFDVPVVFITAYPERLLTGDKPEPAFLITKPFQPEAVRIAISQALFFDRRARLRDA